MTAPRDIVRSIHDREDSLAKDPPTEVFVPTLEFVPGKIVTCGTCPQKYSFPERYNFRIRVCDRFGRVMEWDFQTPNSHESIEAFIKDMVQIGECKLA